MKRIACLEEIAWRMGHIDGAALRRLAGAYEADSTGDYLRALVEREVPA